MPDPLLKLLAWLSPSFPVGAFSYSHGLEAAIDKGLVTDRGSLEAWIEGLLTFGTARQDAALLAAAFSGEDVAELATALRPTSELTLESRQTGAAFLKAVKSGWPCVRLDARPEEAAYPVAVGWCAVAHDIALKDVLPAYLHAFAANLVSVALRAIPLGQTDGLKALANLEPAIKDCAGATLARAPRDPIPGTASLMVDWCSAAHEVQYSRLFRS